MGEFEATAVRMPWGQNTSEETCCAAIGKQRYASRKDIMEYRNWAFTKFMCTFTPSVASAVWPWTHAHMLFAIAVSLMDTYVTERFRLDKSVIQLFTVPTAFLLLFRCNIGYARFWEGRGHFGKFNFALREITRRCYTFIKGTDLHDPAAQRVRHNILRLLMVMAISVRENLRRRSMGTDALAANLEQVRKHLTVRGFAQYERVIKNRPLLIMSWIGKFVHEAHIDGFLPQRQMLMSFDKNVSQLLEGWMGMNTITYQPIPFPYVQTLHWFLFIWIMMADFTFMDKFKPVVFVVVITFAATAMYSLEEMAAEIEDPFGDDLNDLPTENFQIGLERDGVLTLTGIHEQNFTHDRDADTLT